MTKPTGDYAALKADRRYPHEIDYQNARDAGPELLKAALRAREAMDAWLGQYASDLMSDEQAKRNTAPIKEFGTIGYIANVNEQLNAAIAAAQGIETGTGETAGLDAKRESPVGSADAPNPYHSSPD